MRADMKISVSIVEDDAQVRASLAWLIDGSSGCRCVSRHGSAENALQEIPGVKPNVVLTANTLVGADMVVASGTRISGGRVPSERE